MDETVSPRRKAVSLVQQELSLAGYPSLNILKQNHPDVQDLIETLFSILQQRRKEVKYREEISDRSHLLSLENDRLGNSAKLRSKIELQDRELQTISIKFDSASRQVKELTSQNLSLKEELKNTKATLSHNRAQFQHELRKKQRELEKCKERVQKSAAGTVGIVMTETLPKKVKSPVKSLSRTKSFPQKKTGDAHIYDLVVQNYEDREKQLISENSTLRSLLLHLYNCVKTKLATPPDSNDDFVKKITDAHFQMPLEVSGVQVLEPKIKEMVVEVEESDVLKVAVEAKQKIEEMEQELVDCKNIIEEQSKLLQRSLSIRPGSSSPIGTPTRSNLKSDNEEQVQNADFEAEREELEQEKIRLEEERKSFLEAAIRIGKERALLQEEREEFEREKRSITTQHLLQSLPKTPAFLKEELANKRPMSLQLDDSMTTPLSSRFMQQQQQQSFRDFSETPQFHYTPKSNTEFIQESDTMAFSTPQKYRIESASVNFSFQKNEQAEENVDPENENAVEMPKTPNQGQRQRQTIFGEDIETPRIVKHRVAASPAVMGMKSALKKRMSKEQGLFRGMKFDSEGIEGTPGSSVRKSVTIWTPEEK
ncbi:hypothetical protein HK098_002567 [Nowakowskiella sp. JEL0407]|nr:hypothetical protein HK098_002567 [Nowakowskiella sp. JEL0407]